jgi:hypothetical protein
MKDNYDSVYKIKLLMIYFTDNLRKRRIVVLIQRS